MAGPRGKDRAKLRGTKSATKAKTPHDAKAAREGREASRRERREERERAKRERLRIGGRQALAMILPYARGMVKEQLLAIGFLVAYLALFQTIVLGSALPEALSIAFGSGVCALGLSLFLEGVRLGIMPLGEACGLALPEKAKAAGTGAFAFVLGAVATLAEPAIASLRQAGTLVRPWSAPLLYSLLNRHSTALVAAICIGVGVSVVLGSLRFIVGLSLKPLLFLTVPAIILFTLYARSRPDLAAIVGLAWDSGGSTTGPVTVPLVIALGVGIDRVSGRESGGIAGGFGVVALSSLLPVATVLALGMALAPGLPAASDRESFFAPENKAAALAVLGSEEAYARWSANGQSSHAPASDSSGQGLAERILSALRDSAVAIVPLCLILVVCLLFMRTRVPNRDEIALGLAFALAGLALFETGMEFGLTRIGAASGERLPMTYLSLPAPDKDLEIRGFSESIVQTAISPSGETVPFFYLETESGPRRIEYDPAGFDRETGVYFHPGARGPLFGGRGGARNAGIVVLLLFAFVMGYGATIAEPGLITMGRAVEEITVGTFKGSLLVQGTAIGTGIGMALGFARLVFGLPLFELLGGIYLVLLVLSIAVRDDLAAIAWDSAGVTTGPVTVPLVIACGLGVGSSLGVADGFGILALASAVPIGTVLVIALFWQRKLRSPSRPGARR